MEVLSIKDLLKLLKISEGTMYKLIKEGKIRSHKLKGRVIFLKDEIEEDLKQL
jgi:excisionase family DNA binding protein